MEKKRPILLFDFGGVILDHITTRGLPYDRLSSFLWISAEEVKEYFERDIFTDYLSWVLSYKQVRDMICKKYNVRLPENHEEIMIYCMERATLHQEVFDYINDLRKQGYECHLLSDVTKEWKEYFLAKWRYGCLDRLFFSCDFWFSKWSANRDDNNLIYEAVLKELWVSANECVFIDDTQVLLDRAKALGMYTIQATNTAETVDRVKEFLLSYNNNDAKL